VVRCKICGALNGDHVEYCEKCGESFDPKNTASKDSKDEYVESNTFGTVVAFFSMIIGLVLLIVALINGAFEFIGLFYILLGITIITMITKTQTQGERIKSLEVDNEALRKRINEIKEQLNDKS